MTRSNPRDQLSLFVQVSDVARTAWYRLAEREWPRLERFPVNRPGASTRAMVRPDLERSAFPLVVAGYSALAELIELVSAWLAAHNQEDGQLRVVFGGEPFPSVRRDFSAGAVLEGFTEEVRRYWLEEQHISLAQSAKILQTIQALEQERLMARCLPSLHAKAYIGAGAATVGSSNFTATGLGTGSAQVEFNSRFTPGAEPRRYRELVSMAENCWECGAEFNEALDSLLRGLLQVVSWPEALARATAELLEGEWASRYLPGEADEGTLWPAQRAGIAQALWVITNVGGVLVADATGSGKTRMGSYLIRAVRDWLWSTGRVRTDLTTVICGPGVREQWKRETMAAHVQVDAVSHGKLSRPDTDAELEKQAVAEADILAVDEAHNFLRPSARTQQLQHSGTGHKLLFTATPINRSREDLLQLVDLLGADNFDDDTIAILQRLNSSDTASMTQAEQEQLRRAINRFTVRRTKWRLNALVDREPDSYRHPQTGQVCRYPRHQAERYTTGETARDTELAEQIREQAGKLYGTAWIGNTLGPPVQRWPSYSDARWRDFRLRSARNAARFHVLVALRSSRAALVEHLCGTTQAAAQFGLDGTKVKSTDTGDTIGKLHQRCGHPPTVTLDCPVPEWLHTTEGWARACSEDIACYQEILRLLASMSASRERTKAAQIATLHQQHPRLLAFDRHPITLRVLGQHLAEHDITPIVSGATDSGRRRMARQFAPEATDPAVALCSDAFSESYNLQGASAMVHLDLPTTVRWAEQRVGRLDRMDSPHATVEAFWPDDGPAFATRAYELLAGRLEETTQLLGSNLDVPTLGRPLVEEHDDTDNATVVTTAERIQEAQEYAEQRARGADWDGLRDALAPVRELIDGDNPLVPPQLYEQYRHSQHRVLARVSPLRTQHPWAFFAVTASTTGAPYWILLDPLGGPNAESLTDLETICTRLRTRLADNPTQAELDNAAVAVLEQGLAVAADAEYQLLPPAARHALEQMRTVTRQWRDRHVPTAADEPEQLQQQLAELADLAETVTTAGTTPWADPYVVAERWLSLLAPYWSQYRRNHRRQSLLRIRDLTPTLIAEPPTPETLTRTFSTLPPFIPLAERTTACILGVPNT